jgi:hypothetical protein
VESDRYKRSRCLPLVQHLSGPSRMAWVKWLPVVTEDENALHECSFVPVTRRSGFPVYGCLVTDDLNGAIPPRPVVGEGVRAKIPR